MDFGQYFESWFTLCYYICFVPFKIVRNKKCYTKSSNILQQVLCGVIQAICFFTTIFECRGLFVLNIPKNQAFLFKVIERINSALYCIVFFYHVWWRQKRMMRIFGMPEEKQRKNITRWTNLFVAITFCGSALSYLVWFAYFDPWNSSVRMILLRIESFYNDYVTPRETFEEASMIWTIVASIYYVGRLFKWVMIDLLMGLTILCSFATLTTAREFEQLLDNSPSLYVEESKVFQFYSNLKEVVKRFNEFPGPLYILLFILLIADCAVSVGDTLNSKTWTYVFFMTFYFSLSMPSFIIAAEAHFKISQFKKWLLARATSSVSTITEYLEVDNSNLALRGGRIFAITYSFLSTASSVMLTYAIIMIQFQNNKPEFWSD